MSTLLPAMRGKFGSTEYFIITMPAKELTEKLTVGSDLEEWPDLSIEEKYQREINYTRVKNYIAPYLMNDKDRFFGAFIVDVINGENLKFEPITNNVTASPDLYMAAAQHLGTLTLQGNEILVPLDGQHRVKALKFAIEGKDHKGNRLPIEVNPDIANDICTIIIIKPCDSHEGRVRKARKIFNKVNRYAKKTLKGENLITADDDVVAVISRNIISGEVIKSDLINHKSNTLTKSTGCFTTLSTIYDATMLILEDAMNQKISTNELPEPKTVSLYENTARKFWTEFLKIRLFSDAILSNEDNKRAEIRRDYILGKPIIQLALIDACIRLRRPETETGATMDWDTLRSRIDSVNWKVNNLLWQNIFMIGDKVITGKDRRVFATKFLEYYLGGRISQNKLDQVKETHREYTSREELPAPIA